MLIIDVPREITFDLCEGKFKAVISAVKSTSKQSSRGEEPWIRMLFDVQVPGLEHLDCKAGRNFPLNLAKGSDLRNFLVPALGPEFFSTNSSKPIDLEHILTGKSVWVSLRHHQGDGFKKPLVIVEKMAPRLIEPPRPAIGEGGQTE